MIDKKAIDVLKLILKNGNNAEIRRRGNGIVILEIKKEIKYTSGELASGKSNRS